MNGGLGGTLPIAGSQYAQGWDDLYTFLFIVCAVFFAIVIIPMIVFCVKYRERPGIKADTSISHNTQLEFLWTVVPTVIVLAVFVWGWTTYKKLYDIPADAMEVRVLAKSWSWTFQYPDGRTTMNQLFVPVKTNIELVMTSERSDVLHSFFAPHFRIKKDLVPGMFTRTWFRAENIGQYQIFCTEYCGAGHSDMLGKVVVLSPDDYQKWTWGQEVDLPPAIGLVGPNFLPKSLAENKGAQLLPGTQLAKGEVVPPEHPQLALQGKELVNQLGCTSCHSDDGSPRIGPSYKGIFGSQRPLADGRQVLADENYLRQKIENPHRLGSLAGYENQMMPAYAGQLSELQLNAVIAYLKTLK